MKSHFHDLDILMVVAGMDMAPDTISSGKSLGGSETAGIQLAEALAKMGHHVVLYCNTPKAQKVNDNLFFQNIGWIHHAQGSFPKGFIDYARSTPLDLCIVQRMPQFFGFGFETKVNFLWQHDLATKTGPSYFHPQLWNIDKILVVSEFMKKQYQSVHGGLDSLYEVTRNGIDLSLIESVPEQKRDRFRLTYTARPERGLDILLKKVFPRILQMEPRAKLYLTRYSDPAILPLYQELDQVIKQFGDRVEFLGNLGKQALYEHYKQSRLYVYPSTFEEVSCITAQEVGACGAVMIGPWRGALPETCNGAHVLLRDDGSPGRPEDEPEPGFKPVSDAFCEAVAQKTVELIHDDQQWQRLSRQGRRNAEGWTWEPVAERWTALAHNLIAARSDDPIRLTKHFLIHSDVVAAQKLGEKTKDPRVVSTVQSYIDMNVPFLNETDPEKRRAAINEFYEQRSGGARANWQTGFFADQEPRLKVLLNFIEQRKDKIRTLLDFGCAHGGYARAISNAFPHIRVVGVDNSPSLIRCANQMKSGAGPDGRPACLYPDNLEFAVGDENTMWQVPDGSQTDRIMTAEETERRKFDMVVCMEVLEHLPHSEEVARKLDALCKPDGWMAFTVPNGRRERDEFVSKGVPPVHVRAFDLHDIRDLFGKRKNYSVAIFSDLKETEFDRSFSGWFMVTYQKDDLTIGDVNWERKFFLQGPRETLAVCMMARNDDATLRRCLKAVQKIADQIIVVDNGPSTDRTVETALEFDATVRAGTSPFFCYTHMIIHPQDQIEPGVCIMAGFETTRNESIAGAWPDWILWIDADEWFVESPNVYKYLRPNCYYGYGVNQHHLSMDAGKLKVDMPVRLFRNHKDIKFFGIVHEHAELGPNRGMGRDCAAQADLNISHDGYINEGVRRGRFSRNLKLLECDRLKYPERLLGKYLYDVRDNVHIARYLIEANGGQLNEEAIQRCEAVIKMYRETFLGDNAVAALSDEGLQYYSEALAILGRGYEFCVGADVRKQGAQPVNPERFRAETADEAMKIIGSRFKRTTATLEGPYMA